MLKTQSQSTQCHSQEFSWLNPWSKAFNVIQQVVKSAALICIGTGMTHYLPTLLFGTTPSDSTYIPNVSRDHSSAIDAATRHSLSISNCAVSTLAGATASVVTGNVLPLIISVTGCLQRVEAYLTDGLVAHYPFNGNANDESGNANHGTVHGATLTTDQFGNPNSAFYFDGSSYISVTGSESLNIQSKLTVAGNFSVQSISSSLSPDFFRGIIEKGPALGSCGGYYVRLSGDKLNFAISAPYTDFLSTSSISANAWYSFAATYDDQHVKIYLNGNLNSVSLVGSGNLDRCSSWDNSKTLFIGREYSGSFFGKLDDLKIYNRSLSAEEVGMLSALTISPTSSTSTIFTTSTTFTTSATPSSNSDFLPPDTIIALSVTGGGLLFLLAGSGIIYYAYCRKDNRIEAKLSEPIEIDSGEKKILRELDVDSDTLEAEAALSEQSDDDRLTLDEIYSPESASSGILNTANLQSVSQVRTDVSSWLQDHSGASDDNLTEKSHTQTPTETDDLGSVSPSLWAGRTELSALSQFSSDDKNLIAIALQRGLQLLVSLQISITQKLGKNIIVHADGEDLDIQKKLALKRTFIILLKTKDCINGDDITVPWASLTSKHVSRLRRTYKEQLQAVQDQRMKQAIKHAFTQDMTTLREEIVRLKHQQNTGCFTVDERHLLNQLIKEKAFLEAKDTYFGLPEHAPHLVFYRQIQASLNQMILGMDVIHGSLVDRAKYRSGEKIAGIASAALEKVPVAGTVAAIVSFIVDKYTEDKELDRRQPFVRQIVSPVEMSVFSQKIALELTEIYEQQLSMMTKVGSEIFAEGLMRKIWKEISSDQIHSSAPLYAQLQQAATQSDIAKVIAREIKAGKKVGKEVSVIEEKNATQTKRWELDGILHLTGVRVKNESGGFDYYARSTDNLTTEQPATMEWEFGFRLGSLELVRESGMRKLEIESVSDIYRDAKKKAAVVGFMTEVTSVFPRG